MKNRYVLVKKCEIQVIVRSISINDIPPPSKVGKFSFWLKCSETYGKTILRFLFFEIWSILYWKYLENLWKQMLKMTKSFFFRKDAQFSEVYAELIFRFLFIQWYPITSRLGGLNLKVSEVWVWSEGLSLP